jgi:Flp pilus assembly pilin Flp
VGPVSVRSWVCLLTITDRITARLKNSEHGQSAVEYIGILALVALIVLALSQSQVVSRAATAITNAVRDLFTAPS